MQVLQGLEQDFVSKQVKSLETGRDKEENHLFSKFAPARGRRSCAGKGRREEKDPKRRVLRAWSDYVCDISRGLFEGDWHLTPTPGVTRTEAS